MTRRNAGDDLYRDMKSFCLASTPHEQLASERELVRQYGISQTSIRRVLELLVEEGLIYKHQGKGAFVADRTRDNQANGQQTILFFNDPAVLNNAYFHARLAGAAAKAEDLSYRFQVLEYRRPFTRQVLNEIGRDDVIGLVIPWLNAAYYNPIREFNPQAKIISLSTGYEGPGLASVCIDYVDAGRNILALLDKDMQEKLTILYRVPEFLVGIQVEKPRACPEADIETIRIPEEKTINSELVKGIIDKGPQVMIFNDDRDCRLFLDLLIEEDPAYLKRAQFLSMQNKNENLLPSFVKGLEMDGKYFGEMIIMTLKQMIDGNINQPGTYLKVCPQVKR